jgi:hypothetical protein
MMGSVSKEISLLRTLYRELRPSVSQSRGHVYETQLWKYIMKQCRNTAHHQSEIEKKVLRRNLLLTGEYFLDSIRATNEYIRIQIHYKGEGERSPKDLAAMLGFSMPHEPRIAPKSKS